MKQIETQLDQWSSGISSEVAFWRNWFATKGAQWSDEYLRRMSKESGLPGHVQEYVNKCTADRVKVLDVGAGPLSCLGFVSSGRPVDIMAVDPLAPVYQQLYSEFKLEDVPVKTEFCTAEDLSFKFVPGSFDIVHCRNALDHSFDPIRGIEEMLRVCKVGGYVILDHNRNEAENESYIGLHQHNFDENDGRFVVWNRSEKFDVAKIFTSYAEVEVNTTDVHINVIIKKNAEMPDSQNFERAANRLMSIMEGLIKSYIIQAERV